MGRYPFKRGHPATPRLLRARPTTGQTPHASATGALPTHLECLAVPQSGHSSGPRRLGNHKRAGDEAPHPARARARQDAVPLRCTLSLPHSIASPRIFALSKGRSHGSAPPPFHRRPLSAPFPVRWCARPFCRASSTWLRTCHRPRPCLTGINAAHHSPQCEHGISPACDSGRTASLSRPRHHARETPMVERSAPQSQARQDLALPSQALPDHERSPHAYGDRQGAFGASKGCP